LRFIDESIITKVIQRLTLEDYIERVNKKNPVKGKKLIEVKKTHEKYRTNNLVLSSNIEFFQKDPVAEPKDISKGEVVKSRGICSSYTVIKSKEKYHFNSKIKRIYSSWYNLYANYISAIFIECIKEAQKYVNDPGNYSYFSHAHNGETLCESVINAATQLRRNGVEKIINHGSDFGKYDAFRSRETLKHFDNPI